jgi:hypothetical protein
MTRDKMQQLAKEAGLPLAYINVLNDLEGPCSKSLSINGFS